MNDIYQKFFPCFNDVNSIKCDVVREENEDGLGSELLGGFWIWLVGSKGCCT